MGVHYDATRRKYVVRWQDEGRRRSRRFETEAEAVAYAETVVSRSPGRPPSAGSRPAPDSVAAASARLEADRASARDGIYAYGTRRGVRFRFVYRQSDGTMSSRRGFTSRRAAADARRRLVESIERGEIKVARESFGTFWARMLRERRPYLTAGSFVDFETHGRKRLLPAFEDVPLARMDEERVRDWLALMVELVEAGELAPKTVNNARTCLSVALNEACRRGLIPRNPCAGVPALPVDRGELDYLRLNEIGPYLDACAGHYRLLAAVLIGSGARISEALALRFGHLELERGVIRVFAQRDRNGHESRPTKGKRFRSVQIGPALASSLAAFQIERAATASDWLFLCPTPRRGRYAKRHEQLPPNRRTVHEWHEAALVDAGLRDMPLHALRHTAAASWLATGHPLIFVQRQLGHRSITTTEEHYGHLDISFVQDAVLRTEEAIAAASRSTRNDQAVPSDSSRSCVTSAGADR